jgi:hypothetical protein
MNMNQNNSPRDESHSNRGGRGNPRPNSGRNTRRGVNSQGNRFATPGGTNINSGESYQYSNQDGSYYYKNDNGSAYYHPKKGKPVYLKKEGEGNAERGHRGGRGRSDSGRNRRNRNFYQNESKQPEKDYVSEWEQAYSFCQKLLYEENKIDRALSYLDLLVPFLEHFSGGNYDVDLSCSPPPPPRPSDEEQAAGNRAGGGREGAASSGYSHGINVNMFQGLSDDMEEEERPNGIPTGKSSSNVGSKPNSSSNRKPTEKRKLYLILVKLLTFYAELLSMKVERLKKNDKITWSQGAELFKQSYGKLKHAQEINDHFYVFTEADVEEHSTPELEMLFTEIKNNAENISMVSDKCLKKIANYEKNAENRKKYLIAKLNPEWKERDRMKFEVIGEEKWTSNPLPKQDYAERRRLWEEELRDINETLEELEILVISFSALKDENQTRMEIN